MAVGILVTFALAAATTIEVAAVSHLDSGNACRLDLPISSAAENDGGDESAAVHDDWSKELIRSIWTDTSLDGSELPAEELRAMDKNFIKGARGDGCKPSTYGESMEDYERAFIHPEFGGLGSEDVYFDLGGGVGKAVMYAFLKYNVSRAVSVELAKTRFDRSCAALQRLEELVSSDAKICGTQCRARMGRPGHIEMRNANVLNTDLSQATVVTLWSLCFGDDVMAKLQQKLLREAPEGCRLYVRGNGEKFQNKLVLHGRTMTEVAFTEEEIDEGGWMFRIDAHKGSSGKTEL